MAGNWRTEELALTKDDVTRQAAALGHTLTWRNHRGYTSEGECGDCGATVTVGLGYTSCATVRDARTASCSGAGTAVLTEVEEQHSVELIGQAVDAYLGDLADAGISLDRPVLFRDPFAPLGTCGAMSKVGSTCALTPHDDTPHIGPIPGTDLYVPFDDEDALTC